MTYLRVGVPPGSRSRDRGWFILPAEERPGAIGELYKDDKLRSFAELMIDLEEEPAARALVVGELRRLAQ